jgi:hypothetical protein
MKRRASPNAFKEVGAAIDDRIEGFKRFYESAKQKTLATASTATAYGVGGGASALALYVPYKLAPEIKGVKSIIFTGVLGLLTVGLVGYLVPRYVFPAIIGGALATGVQAIVQVSRQEQQQ